MKQISKRLFGAMLAIIMVFTMAPNGVFKVSATAATQSTYVTGDIITYGSYPQTKVSDLSLISALNAQTLQGNNTVTYGGSKYKKVSLSQYTTYYGGTSTNPGDTYQDDNGYYLNTVYWFKFEPIQWRVLSNTNGELFVMADKILDSKAYNQVQTNVTWETCTMRYLLNNDFYNTAFNSTERARIKTSTVVNNADVYGAEGGNDTCDKLFLLSYSEVTNNAYGFSSDAARIARGTDFAKSNGLYTIGENSYWWLRLPCFDPDCANVDDDGSVGNARNVNRSHIGARPAFKINESSISSNISDLQEYNGHSYKVIDLGKNWFDAEKYCENLGGHLVTITSSGEETFVEGLLENETKNCYFIGLSDNAVEGVWQWVTGEPLSFSKWWQGEPNNGNGQLQENFAEIYAKRYKEQAIPGYWNDTSNEGGGFFGEFWQLQNCGFICEWDVFPSGVFTPKSNSTYNIKIIDSETSLPIFEANVAYNGSNFTSLTDGSVIVSIVNFPSLVNQKIIITKSGYKTKEILLCQLDLYSQTSISLEPEISVANLIPDISTGSSTINGPEISFLGTSFPLFSFEGSIDLPLGLSVSVVNDASEKTYRILGGYKDGFTAEPDPNDTYWSEAYNNVKDFVKRCGKTTDTTKLWNQFDSIRGKLKKLGPNVGLQCDGSVAFYVEYDYSTGELILKEGGLVLIAEAAVSQSFPFAPCPIFYAKFELGGKIGASLSWVFSGSGELGPNGEIELKIEPKFGIGVGNDKLLCLEAGLKGTLSGKVKFNEQTISNPSIEEMLEVYVELQLYLKYKVLLWEDEIETDFPRTELYPDFGSQSKASIMAIDKANLKIMPRDYLQTQTKQAQTDSTTVASIDKQSVYPNGAPQMITLSNGNILALWIDDDGTKTAANRTTLFYSVYNGSVWTIPAAVCNSGYADFSATVCTNGDNIGVLWQRGSEIFGDDVTLDDMLANTDLVYSSFDGTLFSTPQEIGTPDNGKYETGYDIESNGTDLSAVWIENSLNDYSLLTGTNTVYAQMLSGGVWQSIETINSSVPGISSLAVGYTGNGRDIAWCADTDGNLSTAGDTELFIDNINMTNNVVDDLNVKFENGSFWFKSNGGLVKLNDDYSATDTGIAFDGNYNIIGNGTSTAAVFTQSDDFSNQVMVSHQNPDGTFTTPVSLYNNGTLVNAFSAVMSADGGITVAMDSKNLSTDPEAATPYTTTDFLVKEFGDSCDLAIGDGLSYDRTTVAPGAAVDLTATVKNNSTDSVAGYILTLTDSSNNVLTTKTVNDSIASGSQIDTSITYTLPSTLVGHEIKLTVEPIGVTDADTTNNSETTQIGLGDLTVAAGIAENAQGALITATVTNSGYTTIDTSSVSFTKIAAEMDLLNTAAVGSIAPGESAVITYQVPSGKIAFLSEYTNNSFVVKASTTVEENDLANNDTTVSISPVRAQSLSISDEALTLTVDETYALSAAVAPMNAINTTVYFVSDSTDVVTVDEGGSLTAVGVGNAIITVISSDGGIVKSCTVTVENNKITANESSGLLIGNADRFITGIDLTAASVAALKLKIANTNLRFLDKDGNVLTDTNTAGTGTRVQLLNNAGTVLDELTTLLYGDINGDGNIDTNDSDMIVDIGNYVLPQWDPVTDTAYIKACDLFRDGVIDENDCAVLTDVQNYALTLDQRTGVAT